MRRLIQAEKFATIPLSIRSIRYLVYAFVGCLLALVLVSWGILLKYRINEALDRHEILFRSRAEQLQANLRAAEFMTLRAQGVLVRLSEIGAEKQLATVDTSPWASRLQQRGDRQYIALSVAADRKPVPPEARLSVLADMLSLTFRLNNVQYRNVQNAYLVDPYADRLYVIPRRLEPARQLLADDQAYQRFFTEARDRLSSKALMERLHASPDRAVLLDPIKDWATGCKVVTMVALVQVDGEPEAILALDFPLSVIFPDADQLSGQLSVVTKSGLRLKPDPRSDRPPVPLLDSVLDGYTPSVAAVRPVMITQRGLPQAAVLDYGLDPWGWHVVDVVQIGELWERFRENTLWLLGATVAAFLLLLGWVRTLDVRLMRPAEKQSQLLQESEMLGRTVIQSAGVGLAIVDREHHDILLANDAAWALLDRAAPGEVERLHEECGRHLASRESSAGANAQLRFAYTFEESAATHSCHLEVLMVETTYEGRAAILYALNDVTAAKQSEARLLEAMRAADTANKAKSSFLATMSHEIRTPLNGVLGTIELLGLTSLEPGQRDQLTVMQHAAQSLICIINDVLDFSKIEAQQMSVHPRPCRVDEIAEEVARRFLPQATRKNLRLLCVIDPELMEPVLLDPLKVEQVLSNLVNNAVKFTEQGKVVISVERAGDAGSPALQLRVIDTGIGIAEEDQHRLFDPFVQAEQSDTRRFGGTGLGLSICRRLVGLMEGEIRLVSEPGLGSSFAVKLPLQRPEPSGQGESRAPFRHALDGLVVGLCVSSRELHQFIDQLLRFHGARAVAYDPVSPPSAPIDVLVCSEQDQQRCGDADVVVEAAAPSNPDLIQTPIRAPMYAWRGLLQSIAAAAGVDQSQSLALPAPSGPAATRRLRVLLVEDNLINQVVMRQQLEWLGQRVDLAGNGAEALNMVAARQYDVILTDLQMPEMDGYTLAMKLRERNIKVPIIAITASVGEETRHPTESAGIDRYLTKPVLLPTLREVLDSIPVAAYRGEEEQPRVSASHAKLDLGELLREDILALTYALEMGDAIGFAGRLHGLGGALATIGLIVESQACRWIEQMVRRSGVEAVKAAWPALRTGIERVIASHEGRGYLA